MLLKFSERLCLGSVISLCVSCRGALVGSKCPSTCPVAPGGHVELIIIYM